MFTDTLPIWKNRNIEVPSEYLVNGTYADYKVLVGVEEIYRGRAYRYNNKVEFSINDVASSYLGAAVDLGLDSATWQSEARGSVPFNVYISKDNFITRELFCTISFWYDWSYEEYTGDKLHYLSDPILPLVDKRQVFMFTAMFDSGNVSVSAKETDKGSFETIDSSSFSLGEVKTYIKRLNDIKFQGEFTEAFSSDFLVWRRGINVNEYIINYNNYRSFTVKDTCSRYCLYYLNARGGWDWLIVEGSSTKNYGYDRYTYTQNYDNTTTEFGKVNYKNVINESWTLNTAWINDTQSAKIWNLFGSTKVYLHDMVDGKIMPVLITNTSQVEKNYRNQGRKLYNYTINVEASQIKKRF